MALILAVLGVILLFLAWAALPLLPTLVEVRRRTDVKPLRVVRTADVDIRHFATTFRTWIDSHLAGALAACRSGAGTVRGRLPDGTPYEVLADGEAPGMTVPPVGPVTCPAVVVACGRLELPSRGLFPLEVSAAGPVVVGEQSVCRAVLAGGDLDLGWGCWSLRWLHARAELRADAGCALHGRASADGGMRLAAGCRFERLHAPVITFGGAVPARPAAPTRQPYGAKEVPGLVEDAAGRWLVANRLEIPPHRVVTSDLVVTGELVVGAGTRILGSVKSHGDLRLAAGVEIEGSLVTWRDLEIGPGCRIRGPVVAEGDARVAAGAELGSTRHPTTLSVRCLEVEAGCVAHGTVWAHQGGLVREPGVGAAGRKVD